MSNNILFKSDDCLNTISFFIPTFSRGKSLVNTINSIIDYWDDDFYERILISDNNETDLARDNLKTIESSKLNYYQNDTNIGVDRNMLRVLDVCNSKYCWMLGDDDCLKINSYNSIKDFLKHDIDCVFIIDKPSLNLITGIYEISNNDIFIKILSHCWDISYGGIILNVNLAKMLKFHNLNIFDKYIGTSHAYWSLFMELFVSKYSTGKIVIINDNIVDLGVNEKTWSDLQIEIYFNHIHNFIDILPIPFEKYKNIIKKSYYKRLSNLKFLKSIARFMLKKNYRFNYIKKYIYNFPLLIKVKIILFLLGFYYRHLFIKLFKLSKIYVVLFSILKIYFI